MLPPVIARIEGRSQLVDEDVPWRTMKRRIAFVTPRFGAEIVGGAEAVARDTALGLAGRGWEVEIFTTCAVNPYTWANEVPEGTQEDSGLLVRRFANVLATSASEEHRVHGNIYYGQPTTLDEEVTWLNALFRTPGMFQALLRERDSFDAVVFAPYLFWNTTVCMPIVADRAVVMPCLHDEAYAHLGVMRHVLSLPASVWFLSGPEHDLAHRFGPVAPQPQRHRVGDGRTEAIRARRLPRGVRHRRTFPPLRRPPRGRQGVAVAGRCFRLDQDPRQAGQRRGRPPRRAAQAARPGYRRRVPDPRATQ